MEKPWLKYLKMPVAFKLHYLDSGSFSLRVDAKRYAKKHNCDPFKYYDTKAFWNYVDDYCEFIFKYYHAIDYYSVMDVIPNAERTWKSQLYMEDKGLNPVPVIYWGTDIKWLERYIKRGHKYIAIGFYGNQNRPMVKDWLDNVFSMIGDAAGRPTIKLHGFGVTSWSLLLRYPWFSCDSASWLKVGAFGGVLAPPYRHGSFVFSEPPYIVKCAYESPARKRSGQHYYTITSLEQRMFRDWLDRIGIPLGRMNSSGEIKKLGVVNDHSSRLTANMLYFQELVKNIPPWPWSFRHLPKKGFGIRL